MLDSFSTPDREIDESSRSGTTGRSAGSRPVVVCGVVLTMCALGSLLSNAWARGTDAVDFWGFFAVASAIEQRTGPDVYSEMGRRAVFVQTAERTLGRLAGPDGRIHVGSREDVLRLSREQRGAAYHATVGRAFLGFAGVEAVVTPFVFSIFRFLLVPIGFENGYRVFSAVNVVLFLGSMLLLTRLAGHRWDRALVLSGTLGLLFAPLRADLAVGNLNEWQLALVACAIAGLVRPTTSGAAAAGAALALAVAVKPNLAFAAVGGALAVLADGRWRRTFGFLWGAAVVAASAAAVSWLAFGSLGTWVHWVRTLPGVLQSSRTLAEGNFAPAQLLLERAHLQAGTVLLIAAVAAWLACALPALRRPAGRSAGALAFPAIATGSVVLILGARLTWTHYYVLTVPLLVLLSGRLGRTDDWLRGAAWTGALLFFSSVSQDLLFKLGGLSLCAAVWALATAILLSVGLRDLWIESRIGTAPKLLSSAGERG